MPSALRAVSLAIRARFWKGFDAISSSHDTAETRPARETQRRRNTAQANSERTPRRAVRTKQHRSTNIVQYRLDGTTRAIMTKAQRPNTKYGKCVHAPELVSIMQRNWVLVSIMQRNSLSAGIAWHKLPFVGLSCVAPCSSAKSYAPSTMKWPPCLSTGRLL